GAGAQPPRLRRAAPRGHPRAAPEAAVDAEPADRCGTDGDADRGAGDLSRGLCGERGARAAHAVPAGARADGARLSQLGDWALTFSNSACRPNETSCTVPLRKNVGVARTPLRSPPSICSRTRCR